MIFNRRWARAVLAGASLALGAGAAAWAQGSAAQPAPGRAGVSAPAKAPATSRPAAAGHSAAATPATPTLAEADTHGLTRLQVCQLEVKDRKSNRQSALRACLSRRLRGESLAGRDCRRQATVGVRPGAHRAQAVARCNGVPQSRRKAPKPASAGAASTAAQPAAGENPH